MGKGRWFIFSERVVMSISNVVCFAIGGGCGSLLTWYLVKNKYAKLAQEEIDSVREVYKRDEDRIRKQNEELQSEKDKDYRDNNAKAVRDYAEMTNKYGYSEISTAKTHRWQDSKHDPRVPYIVSPMDFEDTAYSHYERVELTFYADGILANSRDEVITIQESYESIGADIFRSIRDHFGEYEEDPDVVYVRNEANFTQYEITRDNRTYANVVGEVIE